MVNGKVVVSSFILLSILIEQRVDSQPTINSFEQNSCPQLDEEWRVQAEENQRHKFEFIYERQRLKSLENSSLFQSEEIKHLKVELENKQQRLKTLENVSQSKSQEIKQLKVELENKQHRLKSLENVSHSQSKEIEQLNLELENKRRLVQNCLQQRATVKLIKRIGFDSYVYGVVKVLDDIYVLCHYHNSSNLIKVFEDRNEFRLRREIALSGTNWPFDMVYSNESKCFYIRDKNNRCIWRMTTEDDHRLTKWLTNLTVPSTLSLSIEGHLLVFRAGQPFNQLDIYSLSANLIRSIKMPYDVKNPRDVVQTSAGYYVLVHELTGALNGSMVISQVNSAGQLMNRFTPKSQFQVMKNVRKLFYDSDSNRLFVADVYTHRVILFDSNCLNWIQVLLSQETEGIRNPWSVFYDAIERQLIVVRSKDVDIYEFI